MTESELSELPDCLECFEEAMNRMTHTFGGLETVQSLYVMLVNRNWCGEHA